MERLGDGGDLAVLPTDQDRPVVRGGDGLPSERGLVSLAEAAVHRDPQLAGERSHGLAGPGALPLVVGAGREDRLRGGQAWPGKPSRGGEQVRDPVGAAPPTRSQGMSIGPPRLVDAATTSTGGLLAMAN